jgi:hypothetical protein
MAFYKIDKDSVNSITNALDFFQIPPTNVTVSSSKTFEILTDNPINDPPYHFKIHSSDNYIDPTKIYLLTEFRIRKESHLGMVMTNLAAGEDVAPIQLIGNTFMKNLRVRVNNRDVFNSNSLMAYKTYFTHELSYSPTAKMCHLNEAGYYSGMNDDSLESGAGHEARKALFAGSRTAQFVAKLDADIFSQPLFLLSHIEIEIEIEPNESKFLLVSPNGATRYHLEMQACKLYVKKMSLMDGLSLDIARKLEDKPARYAVRKSEMKSMFISQGRYEFSANLFQEQVPRRIILGLVANADYVGHLAKSPFNFQPFDVREISIAANGRQFPQTHYDLAYTQNRYMRAFHDMNEAIGFANTSDGNGITYAQYGKTHCIYVFNLTNSGEDQGGLFDLIKTGSTAVHIRFGTPVPDGGIMLIAMGEVDSLFMIDRNRTITSDTTV